jgi:hypothetical protein
MGNLFKFNLINNLVSYLTIITFSTATLMPYNNLQAVETNLDFGAINFGIKIEKLVEKIKKAIDKGNTNKIINYMFDIKSEVESFTGKKINIGKQIDEVQKLANAKGQKIDNSHIKWLKKEFQNIEKKRQHRALYMIQCIEAGIPYTTYEADFNFDCTAKRAKEKEEEKAQIPITVTVGVTVSLCGLFLLFVPIPICTTAGTYLLEAGVGILGSYGLDKWDEYNQKQNE